MIERLVAVGLLVLLSPVLLLLAALALLTQGRPVFFLQQRAGLDGVPFTMLKFRTMHADSAVSVHANRVTGLGRVLRRYGLDELPQLVNIALGHMRFVGPRPALLEQVARYGDVESRRLSVPPGLTGWAQVQGRNAISWEERIDLDLWYLDNRDVWLDLRILWRTFGILMSGRGVYGTSGVNPDFRPSGATARKAA
ncbi:MAG: sugar transferase [Rhodothermales bacterium]|nr:sugar transferase [Rhodothermales bacterium]